MAIVELSIGKSIYKIECLESEKETLKNLAVKLNERVNKVSLSLRGADEKTILATAALMITGELERKTENQVSQNQDLTEEDIYDAVSESMENVANYIDKLNTKIRNY